MEYNKDLQKTLREFMLSNEEAFLRCQNILKPNYFDIEFRSSVNFLLEYTNEYRKLPFINLVNAQSEEVSYRLMDGTSSHIEWFLDTIQDFCKHKAIELAIMAAPKKIEKGKYGEVEKDIREAILISLNKDLGLNYFKGVKDRLTEMQQANGQISTGWKSIDEKLFGGVSPGEVTLWAANSGVGKSLFLQNMAINWALAGFDVIYLTLELSEKLVALRLDAMLTGFGTREVVQKMDDTELRISMISKKAGDIFIKYMNPGTKTNDIRAYLKEYEIRHNKKPKALLIDYLDLMSPNTSGINLSDLWVKDKYVSEELRSLASDNQLLMSTAAQLNRCLSLDTKVISNGYEMKIKDIKIGDKLASNDGVVEVNEILPRTIQDVYQIKTKSGKIIKCSAKHLFPTDSGLKNLTNGLTIGSKVWIKNKKMYNFSKELIQDEIVEITYLGMQETLDINVSGNKLFLANDILTHNSAVEEQEHDHSHISGGISKINTVDNVLTIQASAAMKERGELRVQFLKTRSSSGVGAKIYLAYNPISMRITDSDDPTGTKNENDNNSATTIMNKLNNRNRNIEEKKEQPELPTDKVEKNASRLRELINKTQVNN